MDAQALLTPDAIDREMGRPLAHVPDPAGDCHASYARHFAGLFIDTFEKLGIRPDRYFWMSDIYPTGEMDSFIRTALDRAEVVRDIYRARRERPSRRRAGSRCRSSAPPAARSARRSRLTGTARRSPSSAAPRYVTWAKGCGTTGRVSPFGGSAKLPWNLEWAAQWSLFGMTIEPCGKDLSTAGGSRDRSDAIAREVYEREPPLNVAYEFLNIGGRKMSTSKGRGAAAHTIAEVVPPEQLRFLFLRPRPNQAIEFDPDGDRRDPQAVRRVRQVRRGDGRPRGQRRAAGRVRGDVPLLAGRSCCGRFRRGGRLPAGLLAPRAAAAGAGRGRGRAGGRGEGERAHPPRDGDPRRAQGGGPRVARHVRAGARDRRRPATQLPPAVATSTPRSASFLERPRQSTRSGAATSGRPRSSRRRERSSCPPGVRSTRSTARSSGARMGRVPAGCSRSLDPDFVATRLREAAMEGAAA